MGVLGCAARRLQLSQVQGTMGRRQKREWGGGASGFPEKEELKSPPQSVICV